MQRNQHKVSMDALGSLCKRRGFIFQSSEIYDGINGFWDYGPLGCELKRNIREAWWRDIVHRRENIVGLDCSIIMHPKVWEASGHASSFADPMVDCKACRKRFRADMLCEEQGVKLIKTEKSFELPAGVKCPACGSKDLTPPRAFNLMFKTFVGPVEEDSAVAYLRPETAQGIFVQFANVLAVARQKIPIGIAQIGKAFRNEINPRNFTFRSREFEQMELEYFIKPGTDAEWLAYWIKERLRWYERIGLPAESLQQYVYGKDELAHYASACVDVMYDFPFGMQELEGIATRGDFDLSQHQKFSGKALNYFDPETKEKFVPHVVEPSAGVDRIALAILCEAYREEWVPACNASRPPAAMQQLRAGSDAGRPSGVTAGLCVEAEPGKGVPAGYEARTVLRFTPGMAPIKAAVFPLLKNKPELVAKGREVFDLLQKRWNCFWDVTGAIGRRYRRQDEIGTPYGVTIDFQTLTDNTVTLRDRDSMKQIRLAIAALPDHLSATLD